MPVSIPVLRRRVPASISVTVAAAVMVNVVLLAAYLWSRPASELTVRLEVRPNHLTTSVDGRLHNQAPVEAGLSGGLIVLAPNEQIDVDTLGAGSVRRVRVLALETGEVLYEVADPPAVRRVPFSRRPIVVDLATRRWANIAVEVTYANALDASVLLTGPNGTYVRYSMIRRGLHASTVDQASAPAGPFVLINGVGLRLGAEESARLATGIALRSYPAAVFLAAIVTVLALALSRRPAFMPRLAVQPPAWLPLGLAVVLALFVAVFCWVVVRGIGDGLPQVADEAAYLFQARIFASGRIYLDTPPAPLTDAFQFSHSPFLVDYDGHWAAFYTIGHPVTLVPGALVGAPWLIPGLVGGANLLLLFAVARRAFNEWTALIAAALFASSPFVLMQSSSFMSHSTATMYMLASLLAMLTLRDRPLVGGALGGLAFGMFFLTRPLSAAVFLPVYAVFLLSRIAGRPERRPEFLRLATCCSGALLLFGVYVLHNWLLVGSPFENGYQAGGDLGQALGFGGAHSVASGIENDVFNVAALAALLHGWPALIGFTFILLPFVMGRARGFDWFLLGGALVLIASAVLFFTTGPVRGPRYVYEAVPLLILLTARGFDVMAEMVEGREGRSGDALRITPGRLLVGAVAVGLVAVSASGWLLGITDTPRIPGAPVAASELQKTTPSDDRLLRLADAMDIHDALVVMQPCGTVRVCYLSVVTANDLSLHGDIVWVYDLGPEANARVQALYPCRNLYTAVFATGVIRENGRTPPPPGGACDD